MPRAQPKAVLLLLDHFVWPWCLRLSDDDTPPQIIDAHGVMVGQSADLDLICQTMVMAAELHHGMQRLSDELENATVDQLVGGDG